MRRSVVLAAFFSTAVIALAAGASAEEVTYVEHAWPPAAAASKVDWQPCPNGQCAVLVREPGLLIRFMRRDKTAAIEEHANNTHTWYILEGEATFVTGGTIVGRKETQRGDSSGTDIQGGQVRHLKAGDVIVIPPHTPHWWKEIPKSIGIYQVDVSSVPAKP